MSTASSTGSSGPMSRPPRSPGPPTSRCCAWSPTSSGSAAGRFVWSRVLRGVRSSSWSRVSSPMRSLPAGRACGY